jgi:hypothetical protein
MKRSLPAVAMLAVVLSTVVACGGGSAKQSQRSDPPLRTEGCAASASAPASAAAVNHTELNLVAERIQPHAQDAFADVFAGVEVTPDSDRVRVYRKPSAPFDDWIRKAFAPDCIEVLDAAHSAKELNALVDRINEDMRYWADQGIEITELGAKLDGSGLIVGVDPEDVDKAKQLMPARYGTDVALLIEGAKPA